jgi:hypothetical protein
MKKGSFSVGSGVDFLKDNVEKFVFGLAVLVLLFLVVSSFTQERIGFSPDELQTAAGNAGKHIESNNPDTGDIIPPPDITQGEPLPAGAGTIPRDPGDFDPKRGVNTPPGPPKGKRGTASAKTMLVLRGVPMIGAVQLKPEETGLIGAGTGGDMMGSGGYTGMDDEMGMGMGGGMSGGANIKGKRFIIVTGLLPYIEQSTQYTDLFVSAQYQDLMVDRPTYVDYEIERAEVTGSGRLKWVPIDVDVAAIEELKTWAGFSPDVIPPEYNASFIPGYSRKKMAFPLPPFVRRRFGSEAACPPDIPLISVAMMEMQREQMRLQEERLEAMDPTMLWNQGSSGGMGMGEEDYGMGMDMGMGMGMGMDYESGGYGTTSTTIDYSPKPKLFRYLDFDVHPGKSYAYRVKLVLGNPNFEVPEQYLENPDDAIEQFLETEFSESTDPISVPRDTRLLAVSVRAGSRPTDEPSCEMCCIFFNMPDAKESADVFEGLKRGKVVNFTGRQFNEVRTMPGGMGSGMGEYDMGMDMGMGEYGARPGGATRPGGRPRPGSGRGESTTPSKIDYKTGVCILDMTGGERLPGRSRDSVSLGGLLLMGPDGQLEVRSEIGDFEQYADYEPPERRRQRAGANPYAGEMYEGGGGY